MTKKEIMNLIDDEIKLSQKYAVHGMTAGMQQVRKIIDDYWEDKAERHDAEMKTMGSIINSQRKEVEQLRHKLEANEKQWQEGYKELNNHYEEVKKECSTWKGRFKVYEQWLLKAEKERDEWKRKYERLQEEIW